MLRANAPGTRTDLQRRTSTYTTYTTFCIKLCMADFHIPGKNEIEPLMHTDVDGTNS